MAISSSLTDDLLPQNEVSTIIGEGDRMARISGSGVGQLRLNKLQGLTGRDLGSVAYFTGRACIETSVTLDSISLASGSSVFAPAMDSWRICLGPQNDVSTRIRCGEGDRAVRLIKIGESVRQTDADITIACWTLDAGLAGLERGSVAYLMGRKLVVASWPPVSDGFIEKLLGALGASPRLEGSSLLSFLTRCLGPQKEVSIIGDGQRPAGKTRELRRESVGTGVRLK